MFKKTVASITKGFTKAIVELEHLVEETKSKNINTKNEIVSLEADIYLNNKEIAQAEKVSAKLQAIIA